MRQTQKLAYILGGVLLGLSVATSHAGSDLVPELSGIDLGALAQEATGKSKQLMIVYYRGGCDICDELNRTQVSADTRLSRLRQHFVIYATDVGSGFQVACPNGMEFPDHEFMAIKGITELPALVVTDRDGNVRFVENGVTSTGKLLAVSDKLRRRNVVSDAPDGDGA